MASINLDDARAARLESDGEPHDVVFNGTKYEAPAEAPWKFVEWIARGSFPRALAVAVGDEAWDDLEANASRNDVNHLIDALIDVWGLRNPNAKDDEDAAGE